MPQEGADDLIGQLAIAPAERRQPQGGEQLAERSAERGIGPGECIVIRKAARDQRGTAGNERLEPRCQSSLRIDQRAKPERACEGVERRQRGLSSLEQPRQGKLPGYHAPSASHATGSGSTPGSAVSRGKARKAARTAFVRSRNAVRICALSARRAPACAAKSQSTHRLCAT